MTSMGEDAFGIPEHSPSDGAARPRTPTVLPKVHMPLGAEGGLGARPKDLSIVTNVVPHRNSETGLAGLAGLANPTDNWCGQDCHLTKVYGPLHLVSYAPSLKIMLQVSTLMS